MMKRKILGVFFGLCSLTLAGTAYQNEVLRLVNAERSKVGLGALVLDERLNSVAEIKAEDMAVNTYFSHDSPMWGNFGQVFSDYGLSATGENLAAGQTTPAQVVDAWMKSPLHKANILSKTATAMGVGKEASQGVIQGDKGPIAAGTMLWAQAFSSDANPTTNAGDPLTLLLPADELKKLASKYGYTLGTSPNKPGTNSSNNGNSTANNGNTAAAALAALTAAGIPVNALTVQNNGGTSKVFNSLLGKGTPLTNANSGAILKNINAMVALSGGTQKGLTDTLNEIYMNNPATASPQISKTTMDLFTEAVVSNSGIKDRKAFGFSKGANGPKTGEMKVYGAAFGGSVDKNENTKFGKLKRDTDIYGGYGLMEYGITDETSLGVAVGGNSSNSNIKGGSKLDGDSFNTAVYSNWTRGNFNLTSGFGYQLTSFDMKRNLGGLKFKDSYNTNTYNIFTEARYSYDLGNSLYLEPSLYTSWVHVDQDGVNEKNSTLAMKVNGDSFNYVNIKPGLDLVKDINLASGELELSAGIAYNAVVGDNKSDKMSAAFTAGGSNFDLYVDDIENTFEARAKAQHNLNNGVFYNGGVKYRTGDNTNGIIGELGIGYKF